jgi:hypothetical protein
MKKQKVKIVKINNDQVVFKTESGFEFPVPINFIVGLGKSGYEKETYIDFIRKQMEKIKVYMPIDLI